MDTNNWRSTPPSGEATMDTGDWRTQLQPFSRQRIVNKIMDTLKRHLPFSGLEGLNELRKIAVRFEQKIFTVASSQPDYLRRISLKNLTMETKSQNTIPNTGNNSNPPDLVNERLQHMEQLMQSQFTYINQYQHSMVQYMQSSNQAWSHMFHYCAHALNGNTSGWPTMPMFQPPPPPNPIPPPPPPPVDPNIQAQQEEEADDPMRDL